MHLVVIIIYLLKKTTYSNRKASEQDRQAQGALTSALKWCGASTHVRHVWNVYAECLLHVKSLTYLLT